MPNLRALAQDTVLYCPRLTSQVADGVSGDGLMITTCGLLPLMEGSACLLYGKNAYPSWGHLFDISSVLSATGPTWNIYEVLENSGFTEFLEPAHIDITDGSTYWLDAELFDCLKQNSPRLKEDKSIAFYALTMSSHTPFGTIKSVEGLELSEDLPGTLRRYMTCLSYLDSCFGDWWQYAHANGLLDNTVVVVTGDHTVFKQTLTHWFMPAAQRNGLSSFGETNYCPLIVYSPEIKERKVVEEVCYEMDVYPTILGQVGGEQYPWQGFGADLMKDTIVRPMDRYSARYLSDKLIRGNWFK